MPPAKYRHAQKDDERQACDGQYRRRHGVPPSRRHTELKRAVAEMSRRREWQFLAAAVYGLPGKGGQCHEAAIKISSIIGEVYLEAVVSDFLAIAVPRNHHHG